MQGAAALERNLHLRLVKSYLKNAAPSSSWQCLLRSSELLSVDEERRGVPEVLRMPA